MELVLYRKKSSACFYSSSLLISILLFIKPLIDMFYQFQLLDIVYFVIVFFVFLINLNKHKIKGDEVFIILFVLLLSLSFARNINGIKTYIKMMSPFLLFYSLKCQNHLYLRPLLYSYLLIVLINFMTLSFNDGYVYWGSIKTFRGLYFYKTDLACAMSQAILVFLIYLKKNKILLIPIILSLIMCYYSNSRISIVVNLIIILLYFIMKKNRNLLQIFLILFCCSALFFFVYSNISSSNMLTIDFNNFFSEANTQGRSVIWKNIFDIYNNSNLISKLFGVDLVSDQTILNGDIYGSHSMYLKILFSIGIVGIVTLAMFVICNLIKFNHYSRLYKFIALSNFMILFVNGITISVIEYTQFTCFFAIMSAFIENKNHLNVRINSHGFRE